MVLCMIPGCRVKSGNKEGISLFRIPIVVDKNGESYKQLTEDRRNAWISQISRDDTKWKDILKVREFGVDTLFLGSLPYSGTDTTLTGSLHLTWGKRITQKSPICRQRRREPTGRKIATKQGNRFLNNNNVSMRWHASKQLSAVNLTKVASRSRRLTLLHHQGKRDWKARV